MKKKSAARKRPDPKLVKRSQMLERMGLVETYQNADVWKWNILIGIPSLGQVRIEWANAMWSIVLPMNFSTSMILQPLPVVQPLRYHVAEAQNLIVKHALQADLPWDWVLFIEDDVIVPPNLYTRLSKWVELDEYPMISGLYHLKTDPPEPFTFRGRGNGSYKGWQKGAGAIEKRAVRPDGIGPSQVCFCDGVPTGCLMVSVKLLQAAWDESPEITLKRRSRDGSTIEVKTREVFKTTREAGIDPETHQYYRRMGTSDLNFCDKVRRCGWMKKAGYTQAAKMRYPFVVDLNIACGHVDLHSGRVF